MARFDEVLAVNVRGTLLTVQQVVPLMTAGRTGHHERLGRPATPQQFQSDVRLWDVGKSAERNGLGQTLLRVDSVVSWIPPRPSAERVPDSARVVTITAVALNGGQPGQPVNYAPVRVAEPAKVARVTATVNALYRYAGQICAPLVGANGIKLEFRAAVGGPVLATVVATDTGCQQIQFGIPGQPSLPSLGNNGTFVSTVLSIAGLTWYR